LDLQITEFLNDEHVVELSLFLHDLVSINLSHCRKLTVSAFFALVKNCRFLADIRMEKTGIGKFCFSLMDFVVYPQVKSLHLANNSWLSDESIKKFASIFPNLQVLDTSDCDLSEGIVEVLRCCKIVHLNLSYCHKVNLHGLNFEVPTLEVLNLSRTRIDDKTLYAISKSCSGLLQLDLEGCFHVTAKGVKQMIENWTQLKEIKLRHCYDMADDVDIWLVMVLSRPSLRKIVAPSHFRPYDTKWKPLSDHGCFLC
jgi:F-box/leucine-rich repeat protein 2/20